MKGGMQGSDSLALQQARAALLAQQGLSLLPLQLQVQLLAQALCEVLLQVLDGLFVL